jgi:hypothetical protein
MSIFFAAYSDILFKVIQEITLLSHNYHILLLCSDNEPLIFFFIFIFF